MDPTFSPDPRPLTVHRVPRWPRKDLAFSAPVAANGRRLRFAGLALASPVAICALRHRGCFW